jgi:hypothetical protein
MNWNKKDALPLETKSGDLTTLCIMKNAIVYKYIKESLKYCSRDFLRFNLEFPWFENGCLYTSDGIALFILSDPSFDNMKNGFYNVAISAKNIIFIYRNDTSVLPIKNARRIFPESAEPLPAVKVKNAKVTLSNLVFSATREDPINPDYLKPIANMPFRDTFYLFQGGTGKPVIIIGRPQQLENEYRNPERMICFACAIMPLLKF